VGSERSAQERRDWRAATIRADAYMDDKRFGGERSVVGSHDIAHAKARVADRLDRGLNGDRVTEPKRAAIVGLDMDDGGEDAVSEKSRDRESTPCAVVLERPLGQFEEPGVEKDAGGVGVAKGNRRVHRRAHAAKRTACRRGRALSPGAARYNTRMKRSIASVGIVSLAALAGLAFTQAERTFKWKVHDMARPAPPVVDAGKAGPIAPVPSDAIVLFAASKPDLSAWTGGGGAAEWAIEGDEIVVVPGKGDIRTRESFGDVQLHLEWMVPAGRAVNGQQGCNSGVFFIDRYEIQILSSNGNTTYVDGMAGALYGQYPPLVNACRPQGEWNVYDIVFRAPVFEDGKLLRPATVTAFLNGVLVQDNAELLGATAHAARASYSEHEPTGPIRLQDHGDPIRFRNAWVRKLPARVGAE
jgi:hypothetical protein